jgi:hypothetical protein
MACLAEGQFCSKMGRSDAAESPSSSKKGSARRLLLFNALKNTGLHLVAVGAVCDRPLRSHSSPLRSHPRPARSDSATLPKPPATAPKSSEMTADSVATTAKSVHDDCRLGQDNLPSQSSRLTTHPSRLPTWSATTADPLQTSPASPATAHDLPDDTCRLAL